MGVGNELRGDDAVGIYVARNFRKEGWLIIECGTVPEDFTSQIKKIKPKLLVIVDAAEMNLNPGEIRIIPEEKIPKVAFSTHGMPLSLLMDYLKPFTGKIILIGIQPQTMEFGKYMNENVKRAANELIEILKSGDLESIETLS